MRFLRIYKKPAVVLGLALALNVALASSAMANPRGDSGGSATSTCQESPRIVHNEPGICSQSGYRPVSEGSTHSPTESVEASRGLELNWAMLAGLVTLVVAAAGLSVVIRRPQPIS